MGSGNFAWQTVGTWEFDTDRFPTEMKAVTERLYEMGYDSLATDILRRVYWWGTRMPYMGDSCAANMIMNREDTPLQGDISSVSAAQMIFY